MSSSIINKWEEDIISYVTQTSYEHMCDKQIFQRHPDIIEINNALEEIRLLHNGGRKSSCSAKYQSPVEFAIKYKLNQQQTKFFLFMAASFLNSMKSIIQSKDDSIEEPMSDGKLFYCGGEGGAGKTYVIKCLKKFVQAWNMDYTVELTSTLGINAVSFGGQTYQKYLKMHAKMSNNRK